jgi:polyisoprenyl-teichoic acid--peptidoglycan teichoic acid transferase
MKRRKYRNETPKLAKSKTKTQLGEFGCLFLVLVVFALLGYLLVLFGTSSSPKPASFSYLTALLGSGTPNPTPTVKPIDRVNLLVLGVDRRPGEVCPCRSDVMMFASLDPLSLTAALITIPRDLFVAIPTMGNNRINTAMFYGELKNYPGKGPGLAKATVEKTFARPVGHYVVIDFNGFRKIVDALGGIDINVPQAINDPTYPNETYGYKPLNIPAGVVHMNGELALAYSRTRHQDNDFGRSKRQIQVLMAMRDQVLRLDVIPKLPTLIPALWGIIETDLTPLEIIELGRAAAKVKSENLKTAIIDQTMTTEVRATDGEYVLLPNTTKIAQLFDQMIPLDDTGSPINLRLRQEAASIEIMNGTDASGLAERTAQYLTARGFMNVTFDNADRHDYAKTNLIASTLNKSTTIDLLAKIFHVEQANTALDPRIGFDVRIILGKDWTVPSD